MIRDNPDYHVDYDDVLRERLDVRESVIEKFFCRCALTYGCRHIKIIGVRTWPDRALLWPVGITDYIELKRPKGGRYEKGQQRTHSELKAMGFTVETLCNKAEVNAYFHARSVILGVQRKPALLKQEITGLLCATELMKGHRGP